MNKGHFWPVAVSFLTKDTHFYSMISSLRISSAHFQLLFIRIYSLLLLCAEHYDFIRQSPNFRDKLRNHIWIKFNENLFLCFR